MPADFRVGGPAWEEGRPVPYPGKAVPYLILWGLGPVFLGKC